MKLSLNKKIQHFYDQSTQLWLDIWGEHMHHGFYGIDGSEKKDHRQAQIDLLLELLNWANIKSAGRILDAGCGVGGSARFLSRFFGAEVLGLTLSPVQVQKARAITAIRGRQDKVCFQARDIMTLTGNDGPFDLIWSLESAEHIGNKKEMLDVFYRLLTPGGKLLLVTWCHRDCPPNLEKKEQKLLEKIGKLYHLPPMVSLSELVVLAQGAGFQSVQSADWSRAVAPFWNAVIRSAFTWKGISGLLGSGTSTIKGAWAMRYMKRGYRMGTIRFGVLQGVKEKTEERGERTEDR